MNSEGSGSRNSESVYEAVIGLEIHAQLLTGTKLFCGCSTRFGGGDNEHTCPVCLGLPGALPILNRRAIELAIRAGVALRCDINQESVFSRKNYFYPDLPKGYQISQYDRPICSNGQVRFFVDEKEILVRLTRAHLEEDAGKSTHDGDGTFVNLNRSCVPLLEIVSAPEIASAAQAAEYARMVRLILLFSEVCDGNLEEGSLRCDCNVSIRRKGASTLGTRVELKNINSFRFIEKAIDFEIQRQIDVVDGGGQIIQETRLYDSDKNRTVSMRTKEEAHDYRYFPDPDLLPVRISPLWIEEIKRLLPELPLERIERFCSQYQLARHEACMLVQTRDLANFFEEVAKNSGNPKAAANWIMGELVGTLNENKLNISQSPVSAQHLAELIQQINTGKISGKIGKMVFEEMVRTSRSPNLIIKEKGLVQVLDESQISIWIDEVVAQNPDQVVQYRAGREKVYGFFVGQIMKLSHGQASPELTNKLLIARLKKP